MDDNVIFPRSIEAALRALSPWTLDVVGPREGVLAQVCSRHHPKPNSLMFSERGAYPVAPGCLVLTSEKSTTPLADSVTQVVVANPKLAFARVVYEAEPRPDKYYVDYPTTGPYSVGKGTVIGAPGFGYVRNEDGVLIPFPQLGRVRIGKNVDIGCNVCIDRGALEDTIIGQGCKIDNLVHISHNVVLGRDTMVIAGAILCGHVIVGECCHIGPGAVIREGVRVGNKALVGMGAVVVKDVPAGATVMGNPAREKQVSP